MINNVKFVLFVLNFIAFAVLAEEHVSEDLKGDQVARGEVQSCRGCSLNRLPDVKNFIYGDLPKYAGIEFNPIPGAIPHLVLFDKSDKELKRIDLSSYSRDECNDLVLKWFKLKKEPNEYAIEEEEDRDEL